MIRVFFFFICFSIPAFIYSQEICDNGIDDDSDGLIDLQDSDCQCGVGLHPQISDAIPNPNFDDYYSCPVYLDFANIDWNNYNISMNFVSDWYCSAEIQHYNALESVIYQNSCNDCFTVNGVFQGPNYTPPPECFSANSNGFLNLPFAVQNHQADYFYDMSASACLNSTLTSAYNYKLEMDLYNFTSGAPNIQIPISNTFEISLMESTSCANMPLTGYSCGVTD
ncbi:MAG: hypothetical protein AB8B72_07010 [Crocinitomicaceae bacterium]